MRRTIVVALATVAAVVFFNRLGRAPVYSTNEAREGVYVRAMLANGDFVAPAVENHLENGETVPDKPPLFHWIAAAAAYARTALAEGRFVDGAEAAQRFDEWSLRFPSALACWLLVVGVATLGGALVGERAALIAAAALVATPQLAFQSHFGRVDATLTACLTFAVLLAGRAIVGGRPRELLFAGAAAGLAVLAKGPLGLVLTTLAIGAFAVGRTVESVRSSTPGDDWHDLPWRGALLAFLAVALPWYVAATITSDGAIIRSQLFAENLDQFTGGNGRMHFFFYAQPWIMDSAPWNLVALAALVVLARELYAGRAPSRGAGYVALAWLAMLAFFQVAAYKRRAYLLPALPLEALLAGWFLDARLGPRALEPVAASQTVARGLARATLVTVLAAAAVLVAVFVLARGRTLVPELSAIDVAVAAAGGVFTASVLAVAIALARRGDRARSLAAALCGLAAFYASVFPAILQRAAEHTSAKRLVRTIDRTVPDGQVLNVCGIGDDPSLVVIYFFRDPTRVVLPRDERSCGRDAPAGFYLVGAKRWAWMQHDPPGPLHWEPRLEGLLRGVSPIKSRVVFAERRPRESP